MNEYLKFYEKYKISPVTPNINNFKEHVKKRANLYRELSILPITIKDRDILEIGPAGGYNALATYTFNPKSYTLIEPNSTGYTELTKNFENIMYKKNIFIYNIAFENFNPNRKYDIIICEGLIPGLENKDVFINKILNLLNEDGIIVITVIDQIAVLFEIIRKYIANCLTKNIEDIDEKVELLIKVFESHLRTLKGMTRKHRDWCLDNLIGDAIFEHTLTIDHVIDLLQDNFYFLGSSPGIFTNFTWYKELPTNALEYNNIFKEQFFLQWHNFIDYRYVQPKRTIDQNTELGKYCLDLIIAIKNNIPKKSIINILLKIKENLLSGGNHITVKSIEEIIHLLHKKINYENINKLSYFQSAFGRGQSYISFTKRCTHDE